MIYEKKCPQCETVNISQVPITTCDKCKGALYTVDARGVPANPRLDPCEDCHIPISRAAENCPYCGRFYRDLRPRAAERDRRWWVTTILIAVSAFAFVMYWMWMAAVLLAGGDG